MFTKSRSPLLVIDKTTGGVKGGRLSNSPSYNAMRQKGHGGDPHIFGNKSFRHRWSGRKVPTRTPNWKRDKPTLPIYAFSAGADSTTPALRREKALHETKEAQFEFLEAMEKLDVQKNFSETVAVWYHPNDLRLHDHYPCALAVDEAEQRDCPLVAMFCFDIRTFAQPSLLGGFYRQSPMRASYLIETVRDLRNSFRAQGTELFVRVGLPEVEIPLLAQQLGCSAVFSTTQYAPHEKFVQDKVRRALSYETHDNKKNDNETTSSTASSSTSSLLKTCWNTTLVHIDDLTSPVHETPDRFRVFWDENQAARIRPTNPYDCSDGRIEKKIPNLLNKHLHEEGVFGSESNDESIVSANRFVSAVDSNNENDEKQPIVKNVSIIAVGAGSEDKYGVISNSGKLSEILNPKKQKLLPSFIEKNTQLQQDENSSDATSSDHSKSSPYDSSNRYNIVPSGALPNLRHHLGYGHGTDITTLDDQGQTHFGVGEDYILNDRIPTWLNERSGLREYVPLAKYFSSRIVQDGKYQAKMSVWLSHGSLSPRKLYETVREFSYNKMGQGTTETAVRELHQRLARRDFWHFLGVKYGRAFFFPFGPRPDETDDVPDPRYDRKIVQRWCAGLNGVPFVDASMKEMMQTGWANVNSRKAMIWTLTRGYGQDWRLGAEWMERNLLDYDPFTCYGCCMFESGILKDRFFDGVKSASFIANQNDGTGVYTKHWLPLLTNVPDFYLHRVHVMTKKMQKLHGVILGKNYPYPVKLWDGALEEGKVPLPLPSYFTDVDEYDHLHQKNHQNQQSVSENDNKNNDDIQQQQNPTKSEAEKYDEDCKNRFNNDIREKELSKKISSIHIEARRGSNLIDNRRVGWGEAKRHNRNLLENDPSFFKAKSYSYDSTDEEKWGNGQNKSNEEIDSSSYSLLMQKSEVFPVLSAEAIEIGEKVEASQYQSEFEKQQNIDQEKVPAMVRSGSNSLREGGNTKNNSIAEDVRRMMLD